MPDPAAASRLAAVDVVKAAAIVAVALTHSSAFPWAPGYTRWDFWLCSVLVNFQVPAFLLMSGFLYFRPAAIPGRETGRRMARVVVPYLVASAVAYALGIARAHSAREAAFQLATASTVGIYYFVFLLALFVPTIWGLSRLSRGAVWALCAALWVASVGMELYAHLRIIDHARPPTLEGFFWLARSPFNFNYAMFVSGWLAAAHRDTLADVARRRPAAVAALLAGGAACYLGVAATWPFASVGGLRMLYTLCLVGLVALAVPAAARVPAPVRFLSTASLGLYLYHVMFQAPITPHVQGWPAPARIVAMAGGGLTGAAAVCLAGRAALGRRARWVVGA